MVEVDVLILLRRLRRKFVADNRPIRKRLSARANLILFTLQRSRQTREKSRGGHVRSMCIEISTILYLTLFMHFRFSLLVIFEEK